MAQHDLYHPNRVTALFDEMSGTYGFVNLVASLGFTYVWRYVVVSKISKQKDTDIVVVDLMSGMGELFSELRSQIQGIQKIAAIDFSSKMCERAREKVKENPFPTEIIQGDVFDKHIPDQSADIVVCSFGLKTFSLEQQKRLASEVKRILKPGGQFSFIEISIPKNAVLRFLYSFYVQLIIPFIGKICLGNPDNYRHLGIYTKNFGNSRNFHSFLAEQGLQAQYFEHFYGCASGVFGERS
ncbi:class I SAM-dependent methyltransferase [bacterium]|jgi:demethylmenaquinone methyltransferase/2-methoxy-6-polyprenyl-1,4-benzoquinol methylase|nr:class I SAM-dependent methyltransferase [bacterium]